MPTSLVVAGQIGDKTTYTETIALGGATANFGPVSSPPNSYNFTNGTSAGGTVPSVIDLHYETGPVTLAAGASVTYTLSALTDAQTRSIAFRRVRDLLLQITARNDGDFLQLGGAASHPWGPFAGGVNDVQTVSISGTPTGGSFTLTYSGQTTTGIAYNATAANVQSALQALSNVGANNVGCAGGPFPGSSVVCTFQGALGGGAQTAMTHTDSFTGGSSPSASVAHTTTGANGVVPVYDQEHRTWANAAGCPVLSGVSDQLLVTNLGAAPVTFQLFLLGCST